MAKIGKCSNRVGCTLAYTGQEIRFEGSPVCPECGQPLTEVAKPKKNSKLWLLILIPVLLLVVAAHGFYTGEKYLVASDAPKRTPTPTPHPPTPQHQPPTQLPHPTPPAPPPPHPPPNT